MTYNYQCKTYVDVPCSKCGETISREQSQVKRGIDFICDNCRMEKQRLYVKKQYQIRRKIELAIRRKMEVEGKSLRTVLRELTV